MALTASEKAELDQLEKEVGSAKTSKLTSSEGLTPDEQKEMSSLEDEVGHLDTSSKKKDLGWSGNTDKEVLDQMNPDKMYPSSQFNKDTPIAAARGLVSSQTVLPIEMATALGTFPIVRGAEALSRAAHPSLPEVPYTSLVDLDTQQHEISRNLEKSNPGLSDKFQNVGYALPFIGAAEEAAGTIGNTLKNSFSRLAKSNSAKALGVDSVAAKKMTPEAIQEIGEYGLDNKIVTPLASTEEKIAKNKNIQKTAMDSRSDAYSAIDSNNASTFNPTKVAVDVANNVGDFNRLSPLNSGKLSQLRDTVEAVLMRGNGNISMSEAQSLVEELGSAAKFDTSRSTGANDIAKQAYNEVRNAINESAANAADKVNISGLRQIIENANKQYSIGEKVSGALKKKQGVEFGRNFGGPTDVLAGAVGFPFGGPTGSLKAIIAKKAAEKYGRNFAATGFNALSESIPFYNKANASGYSSQMIPSGAGMFQKLSHMFHQQAQELSQTDNPASTNYLMNQRGLNSPNE